MLKMEQLPCAPDARLAAVLLVLVLSACAVMTRPDALPGGLRNAAEPLGIPGLRIYPDRVSAAGADTGLQVPWPTARMLAAAPAGASRDLLALSSGGDGAAFAAGLLTGWSRTGTRPRFAVVTGVSAGALLAPFAFLGPRYDHVLREVTLSVGPGQLFRSRGFLAGLFGDGFSSSAPLEQLLARYVTPEVLEEIAAEYCTGRALFIMTTDLDASTSVIWNMGAIAASHAPGSLGLFRKVMLASASIPGVVSPVLIDVTAGGRHFHELHVDGGVAHQVFLYPSPDAPAALLTLGERCRAFIVMNMELEMAWSATPRRALRIGSRAVDTMIRAEARNDVESIYTALKSAGAQFRLAYIGQDFKFPHSHDFDNAYMHELFAYGLKLVTSGHAWHLRPPQAQPPVQHSVSPTVLTLDEPARSAAAVVRER